MANCQDCNNQTTPVECTNCQPGYFNSDDRLTCTACNTQIPDCAECSGTAADLTCTRCTSPKVPFQKGCDDCNVAIPNCATCDSTTFPATCSICAVGFYLADDAASCVACTTRDADCAECSNVAG